jgi:hypothetical protein
VIGKVSDRRLRQAGSDGENGERKAQLDIADAELGLEKGKQHRQHEHVEMADPMGRRVCATRRPFLFGVVPPERRPCQLQVRFYFSLIRCFCGPGRQTRKYRLPLICP